MHGTTVKKKKRNNKIILRNHCRFRSNTVGVNPDLIPCIRKIMENWIAIWKTRSTFPLYRLRGSLTWVGQNIAIEFGITLKIIIKIKIFLNGTRVPDYLGNTLSDVFTIQIGLKQEKFYCPCFSTFLYNTRKKKKHDILTNLFEHSNFRSLREVSSVLNVKPNTKQNKNSILC